MKKLLSLVLALMVVITAIPFTAVTASAATMYMGDANGDGKVTAIDARTVLQVASGSKTVEEDVFNRIDMDKNGKVTAIDARKVLQTAAGSLALEPVQTEPSGPEMPTPDELKGILYQFGYEYDAEQNIFYTHLYPWQRYFGFTDIYDDAASYVAMNYMTLKIDFEYEDLLWRLQWWKGQYGVLEGAELGVYTKDPALADAPFYECAADPQCLEMYFEYYKTAADYNKGNVLFTRYEQRHWWLTGFKFGICDPTKNVVKASLIIEDDIMADGIEEGLKNVTDKTGRPNGFKAYKAWLPIEVQGHNFYIREKLDDGRTMFTVVWKDAGYLNYGEEHECDYGEPVVTKEPTCVAEGSQKKVCKICGYEKVEPIPATGKHDLGDPVVTKEPTCVSAGLSKATCKNCDYYYVDTVPATGIHDMNEAVVVTAPTCVATGLEKATCKHCDHFVETVIPATGIHDMNEAVVVTEATCTTAGLEKATCKNCDHFVETAIPAKGHDMGEAVVVTEATCTTAGLEKATCKNCDHFVETAIPAKGHDMGEAVVVTEATCTTAGLEKATCKNCDHFVETEIPAKGHDMGDAVVVTEATCTTAGLEKATCKNCDHFVETEIPAKGHDMGDAVVVTEATCTTAGLEKATCKNCDHFVETAIPATGHDMGDWTVVDEPTTETEGLKEKTCQNDGCDYKETETIAKLPTEVPEEPDENE